MSLTMTDSGYDINEVVKRLPHRYPFLLIDRVIEVEPQKRLVAIKNVTMNEPFFQGHFPGRPIMPGVLIVEALAQAAGVLAVQSMGLGGSGKLVYFMSIDGVKFRAPVEPGCLLDLEVEFTRKSSRVCKFKGRASVEGQTTCEVEFTAMIADPPKDRRRACQSAPPSLSARLSHHSWTGRNRSEATEHMP